MVYVTHKTPTTRSSDTFTGKIIGWLEEYLFWLDIEGKCSFIDQLIPEVFIIGSIDDILISIFQNHYNANYQKVYSNGADKGNQIHNQIFGKFDDVITDYKKRIEDATSTLNGIIDDAKKRISQLSSKIDGVNLRVSQFVSKIGEYDTKMNNFSTDISGFSSKIDGFKSDLSNAYTKLNSFEGKLRDALTKLDSLDSLSSELELKTNGLRLHVLAYDQKIRDFTEQLKTAEKTLSDHKVNIDDLLERVKKLETGKMPFQFPELKLP